MNLSKDVRFASKMACLRTADCRLQFDQQCCEGRPNFQSDQQCCKERPSQSDQQCCEGRPSYTDQQCCEGRPAFF
ncbi:unnamed protein product [Rodentolepis nana]|uniref:EB domain-containing protein n=1 Tax=Rodentolepis nana TaxID=102285 RepID=A0A0R3U069_RODNA|nr:unnamed protein product [Rodentolepis nana]